MFVKRIFSCLYLILASMPLYAEDKPEVNIDITAGLEFGYNDQVIIEELDLQSSIGDQFTRYRLKGELQYSLDDNQELTFSLGLTNRRYHEASSFDLQTVLSTIGYSYDFGDLKLGIDIRSASSELGGNDFLTLDHFAPYFTYFIKREHFVRGSYTAADKILDNNPIRNSESDEYALDYYYFINGLNRYIILSGKWRDQNAQDYVFNFISEQYRIAYHQRFNIFDETLKMSISYRYRERDYNSVINPLIGGNRIEEQGIVDVEISWEIIEDFELYAELRSQDNASNLPNYSFTNNRYGMGLVYKF